MEILAISKSSFHVVVLFCTKFHQNVTIQRFFFLGNVFLKIPNKARFLIDYI